MWEARLHRILVEEGWRLIEGCRGTYIHDVCGAVLIVYVDDLLMVAGPAATEELWQKIESQVDFRDPPSPICQYLGAHDSLSTVCNDDPRRGRELKVHMQGYTEKAVGRFEVELGSTLPRAQTPYVPEKVWTETPDGAGEFVNSCASHVATLLFLSRVCCPDVSSAARRLCSAVSQYARLGAHQVVRVPEADGSCRDRQGVGPLRPGFRRRARPHRLGLERRGGDHAVHQRRVRGDLCASIGADLAARVGQPEAGLHSVQHLRTGDCRIVGWPAGGRHPGTVHVVGVVGQRRRMGLQGGQHSSAGRSETRILQEVEALDADAAREHWFLA